MQTNQTPNQRLVPPMDWVQTLEDLDPDTSPILHPELLETSQDARDKLRRIEEAQRAEILQIHRSLLASGKEGLSAEYLTLMGYRPEDFDQP